MPEKKTIEFNFKTKESYQTFYEDIIQDFIKCAVKYPEDIFIVESTSIIKITIK